MKFARGFLIFCYGLFTIAAQTLLFREFITTFQGSDISVGLFFASWFFWIGLGAAFASRSCKITDSLQKNIDLLFFAYIPAFVLELFLIVQARHIASVSSYTLLSIRQMIFLSLLVNSPISIITGLFFPLACRWIQSSSRFPVSNVYIIEAAGAFLGGIAATVLLAVGVSSITIFFLLAFLILFALFLVNRNSKPKPIFALALALCILFCLTAGVDRSLNRHLQTVKWSKLLPPESMAGSFQTPQAEYLYGTYRNQWVVLSQASTVEAIPDRETTGRIAAIALSQKPDAKKILVIGSGYGLCCEFLKLPQIENITWTHCDNQYIQQFEKFLPPKFKTRDARLLCPPGDIRTQLSQQKNNYDIVIINLPQVTSSVLNRYFTVEFYQQLKNSIAADGIVAVRVTAGENIMGTELIDLGASIKSTLAKVFSHFVLTTGDDSWFIASDSYNLTGVPGTLRDRFATIKNASAVFAPPALLSVYLPDRAAAAIENYNDADLPQRLLINTDSRPLTNLYSLLLASKQSGAPVTKIVKLLASTGAGIFLIPIFVFVILRLLYIIRSRNQNSISSLDSSFLVFTAGWLGIAATIVLMYLYQTRFGSLYLHIGVISSLFMIGIAAGAALIRYSPGSLNLKLFIVIPLHAALLVAIVLLPLELWTHWTFAAIFFLCGMCSGAYFPIAAKKLADCAFETGLVGAKLELADHIGASAGSLVTGLALVPILGTKGTIAACLVLLLANIPTALLQSFKKIPAFAADALYFRKVGYVLFGIAASVIICSNLLMFTAARSNPSLPRSAAQTLAGQMQIKSAAWEKFSYFKVYTKNNLTGYIFSSQDFAPEVIGFGGVINLAVYIDTTGKLIDFQIIHSNETPDYLELLSDWFAKLKGHLLFKPNPLADVDTTTGATISATAIVKTIETASKKFNDVVLSQTVPALASGKSPLSPDRRAIYLLTAVFLSLLVIYKGNFYARLFVLAFNVVVGGLLFNVQYSSEQVSSLLSGHISALLIIGVPILILLFGNIYCGYLCPFGALQELVSYIIPDKFKRPAVYETMRKARFVKYVLLFIMVIVFFLSRSKQTLIPDPLITAFNFKNSHIAVVSAIIILALAGSIFYRRFWCRYLCPVGAFLSLFNNLIIFKRLNPPKLFGLCEFGLTAKDNMDCIYCDRCRYFLKSPPSVPKSSSHVLLILVLIFAILISLVYIGQFVDALPSPAQLTPAANSSFGQPRDVDLPKIRTMIKEKKLSDHPADFYEKK
jgi:predicted membrane-bound spermidine synthase